MRVVVPFVERYPTGFAQWLVGDGPRARARRRGRDRRARPTTRRRRRLLAEVRRGFRPNQVVSVAADPAASVVPLLRDRVAIDGRPTAYVCRGFVCRLPVTDPDALREQLEAGVPVAEAGAACVHDPRDPAGRVRRARRDHRARLRRPAESGRHRLPRRAARRRRARGRRPGAGRRRSARAGSSVAWRTSRAPARRCPRRSATARRASGCWRSIRPSAGRGIGRALTEACIARARAEGRTGMTLYTLPTMVRRASVVRIARLPARPGARLGVRCRASGSGRTRSGSSRGRDAGRRRGAAAGRDRRPAPTGPGRARGPPDPPARDDGLRRRRARLPGRSGRRRPTRTRRSRRGPCWAPRTPPRRSVATSRPDVALAAHMAAIRELFEEAGVLLADTAASAERIREARSALLRGRGDAPRAGRCARSHAADRPPRPVVALGHAGPQPAPVRHAVLRGAAARTARSRRSRAARSPAHVWLRPADALAAMADGRLVLWLPTSTTLQQLEHVTSFDEIRERLAPGRLGEVVGRTGLGRRDEDRHACRRRRRGPAGLRLPRRAPPVRAGGPGRPDRTGARAGARRRDRARRPIDAIALTHADPDHAGGAEALAERLGIPVLAGPGAGRSLPYDVRELADLETVLPETDVPLRAVTTPGPRPDHLAFIVGDGAAVITGDLDGVRGRALDRRTGRPDRARGLARAARASRPGAVRLPGHPPV